MGLGLKRLNGEVAEGADVEEVTDVAEVCDGAGAAEELQAESRAAVMIAEVMDRECIGSAYRSFVKSRLQIPENRSPLFLGWKPLFLFTSTVCLRRGGLPIAWVYGAHGSCHQRRSGA